MKSASFLLLAFSVPCLGGTLTIETKPLPDLIAHELLDPAIFETGFYPAHAPPGRYTQQQIDAALVGLEPLEIGILSSTTEHRSAGETLVSRKTVVDPNGALHGLDFTGDPLDHQSWLVPGAADLTVNLREQATWRISSRDFITREYVRKPRGNSNGTVDISTWTSTTPTDLVETATPVLKYSPATVPSFIPAAWVQDALASATPGQEIPLAAGYGVVPLGIKEGATTETLNVYNVEFGTDYIGDPDDYFTWIAITEESIQVSVFQVTEMGQGFLDQTISYVLVVPDSNGQVILNPPLAVVTEVTDTTHTWDKVYFTASSVPPEVEPGDAATLAVKVQPGNVALALHTTVDTPGDITRGTQQSIDAHGAVHGVDYTGNPSNPATWTALTANDVIVDRLTTTTLTSVANANHKIHTLYHEASTDPGETGELHIHENAVVGRDIERVTRRYLNRSLDLEDLPEGITTADVQAALAWADPGETIIAGQTRTRALLSTESTPLPDFMDTNGWTLGVDFLGDPGDMNSWHAAGASDIHIDIYHPVSRTRNYEEVVTNHLITAPAGPPATRPVLANLFTLPGSTPSLHAAWKPPYGMESGIELSSDLSSWTQAPGLHKADGRLLRHSGYFPPSQPTGFLRVSRR